MLLVSPTITGLQCLLNVCESELCKLDMQVNTIKSMCIRFGQRFKDKGADQARFNGSVVGCRYLGVIL